MADSFFTDGMTVDEIMKLDYDTINSLDKRDLSRAVRTISLAANKRVKRLKENREDIAQDALNWLSDQGYGRKKFGSKNKSLNQLRHEFFTARNFMNMKTSKVKGAIAVRKGREERIMGETREQAVSRGRHDFVYRYQQEHGGRAPSMKDIKKEMKRLAEKYNDLNSTAWEIYRKTLEMKGWPNSPYTNYYGSDSVLELIGSRVGTGQSDDDILEAAKDMFDKKYEEQQQKMAEEENDDGLEMDW